MDTMLTSKFSLPAELDSFISTDQCGADAVMCFYNGELVPQNSHFDERVQLQTNTLFAQLDVRAGGEKPFRVSVVELYGNQLGAQRQEPFAVSCRHHYHIQNKAEIIETHIALNEIAFTINNASSFELDEGATADYAQTYWVGDVATVNNKVQSRLRANSQMNGLMLNVGSEQIRNNLNVDLAAQGAKARLQALVLATNEHQIETVSHIRHLAPETKSEQLVKSVINKSARFSFTGHIEIAKKAQKSDASQLSQNLLLSREGTVKTEPQLDVGADDVKATHGATVGQLDESQLFYLTSRGVPRADARNILALAYQRDVLERLNRGFVRNHIEKIHARFAGGG